MDRKNAAVLPVPVLGYTDDLSVLLTAITTVAMNIDEEVKEKARQKMKDWFG
jgi:uncharacterized membrane protein YkvA (DUF1232 family)